MMQIPDTATQSTSSPEVKAVESAPALPASKDDRPSPLPLPQPSGTPYAVRLLAITSTVGVSAILLGQGLWQADTNAARLPASEDAVVRNSLPTLRDRVSVTTLQSVAMSLPESLPAPINATRPNQLKPSTDLPTVRISRGFENAGQPALTATLPAPPVPIPTLPTPKTSPSIAVEPSSPAPKQHPRKQADQTATVIAALLEAPKPRAVETQTLEPQTLEQTATIAPRTTAPTAIASAHNPSQTALIGGRDTSEPAAPTGLAIPAVTSMQLASTMRVTTIEQAPTSDEGVYLKLLTITGNTRFSSKELVAVVQKAIAANIERLSANDQPVVRSTQWELRQASEAITQFYAAQGYTNVQVDVSTAAFNGAMPAIRIVEDTLETSRLSLP
ncbi:MAG: hypothetical protein RBJ76_25045 [Stenomitos frigidus ULC029]